MNCHGHYWCCFHYFKKLWILCCLHKYESWFHFMLFGKVEGRSLLCLIRLNLLLFCGKLSSVQFSRSVVSDSLRPHELQDTRPPIPSPNPRVHSNSCPSSRWCHPAISSSVIPFSSCPQSLPASESSPMSQLFAWGGQSIRVSASASVLLKNTQDWSPLGWTVQKQIYCCVLVSNQKRN